MSGRAQVFNAIPSVLWTAIFACPFFIFCARYVALEHIYIDVAAGLAAMMLPRVALEHLALSSGTTLYRNLRVPVLIKITQDAGWLRRLGGSTQPLARRDKRAIRAIVANTWMRERFHLGLGLSCVLCSVEALLQARFLWFLVLTVMNVLYNFYPMWLQQYLRLRVAGFRRRGDVD